jgi:hypothetical protein
MALTCVISGVDQLKKKKKRETMSSSSKRYNSSEVEFMSEEDSIASKKPRGEDGDGGVQLRHCFQISALFEGDGVITRFKLTRTSEFQCVYFIAVSSFCYLLFLT